MSAQEEKSQLNRVLPSGYEDFLKTTIGTELWMCAVIFFKYVRAEKRKCKDDSVKDKKLQSIFPIWG